MAHEVEVRARVDSEEEFNAIMERASIVADSEQSIRYRTFLFREPEYLRIRIREGAAEAVITRKGGDYYDQAREEKEHAIPVTMLSGFVQSLKKEGYSECVNILAESHKYVAEGMEIACNRIDALGRIVEVEMMTDDEDEVPRLYAKVRARLRSLGLQELSAKDYQAMMDGMYDELLLPVDEQEFRF